MTLNIEPVAKGRPRFMKQGHTYTPESTRRFERELKLLLKLGFRAFKPALGPLKLTARFILTKPARPKHKSEPITRPDTDNYLKGLMDAANGILWLDDSQVVHIDARKLYAMDGSCARIEIEVSEVNHTQGGRG